MVGMYFCYFLHEKKPFLACFVIDFVTTRRRGIREYNIVEQMYILSGVLAVLGDGEKKRLGRRYVL